MPAYKTRSLGTISVERDSLIEFPRGLPGFEQLRRFAAVRIPHTDPLIYLQSLEDPAVCFPTAPIRSVCPGYELEMDAEDLELVGLPRSRRPAVGSDVWCLAVLSVRESGASANLRAPIVVNIHTWKAVQAISPRAEYSHRYELALEEAAVCS